MTKFKIKRVYESAEKEDGFRVLCDRLWPRGIKKDALELDMWAKDITPSTEIRKLFAHKPENFPHFKELYLAELEQNPAVAEFLKKVKNEPVVTLLYAAKDEHCNHAMILRDFLQSKVR